MKNQSVSKFFGIVEGFFSDPLPIWTNTERAKTLGFISKFAPNLNTYVYCPKNDPYVTKLWGKNYPKSKLAEIKKFIDLCKAKNIEYFYGFNPQIQENTVEKIRQKIAQLKSVGCQNFMLLFDDIAFAYELISNPQSPFGKNIAKEIVRIVNSVPNNIWVCLPDYCFTKKTPFTKEIRKLKPEVPIIWTGNQIFSKTATNSDLNRVNKILGPRKIIWWSNFPVNDCEQNIGEFNLGGFTGVNKNTLEKIAGVIVNPMREPYASLPFFITFSKFIKNPQKYSNVEAWQESLATLDKTKWKKYYYISINRLTLKTRRVSAIFNKITENKNVGRDEIIQAFSFPTRTDIPRYFPEIFEIMAIRIRILKNFLPNWAILELKQAVNCYLFFKKNYAGAKQLFIKNQDKTKFIKAIEKLVDLNIFLILELANNKGVTPEVRIQQISRWQNINRFFRDPDVMIKLNL